MATETLYYSMMDSPIGPLLLASTKKGLCNIEFGPEDEAVAALQRWSRKWGIDGGKPIADDTKLAEVKNQLTEYFTGQRKSFTIPFDLYGTPFQKIVWQKLLDIPFGEVWSYKDVAIAIGASKAVRAIGGANNRNPIPVIIPCHRVVGSNGALVGYGGGMSIKETLLTLEGVYDPISKSIV
ncbi:methylated-DNA--[protein]-cysteine S-methyltransferase [Brevibacillus sp. SYSU BS000544]|uniref:methylated-DNA--[protein]-cysteine S-methyltransferase n=1 Tax=Brevibacillus sp. SYSU BS000544 TaxID=3416443 RepID=UPI003CE46075